MAKVSWLGSLSTQRGMHIDNVPKKVNKPSFLNVVTGDYVRIEPNTSFGDPTTEKVTDILTKYDQETGKPYKVICFGNHRFDARDGCAINPPYAYHLSNVVKSR